MSRDFGGQMRLRLASGMNLTMRAGFTLGSSGISVEAKTNQDGSVSRLGTPRPRTAEVTFEDGGEDVNAVMKAPRQDIYITEEFTGVTHIFSNAFFSGEPFVDRATGEWTGMTINSSNYQRIG
ncbi:phage tail tube protein [Paracoccus sp. (in: a-proteobacteria)]|uniref:phage tail tube protein n=1 Tax=Paracoccus sp. TaxID=267 RepID=UPI002B000D18|nr:phage tail tube protein [Paracoccus sp. (in: a-proteobacteria)]